MNLNEKHQKLLERYFDNALSDEQQVEFDLACRNEKFREELLFQAQMIDAHESNEEDVLKEQLESFAEAEKKSPKNNRKLVLVLGLAILSILIYFFLFHFKSEVKQKDLYAQYFIELPANMDRRGEKVMQNEKYKKAMQSYIEKDYNNASIMLSEMIPQTEDSKLYQAICYIQLTKNDAAKEILASLDSAENIKVRENSQWYLALMFLKEEKYSEAKEILQSIYNLDNHRYASKAKELLKEMTPLISD